MNNGTTDPSNGNRLAGTPRNPSLPHPDELNRLKRDLLKAEVLLAKARAAAACAEVDIKVLTSRLKARAPRL